MMQAARVLGMFAFCIACFDLRVDAAEDPAIAAGKGSTTLQVGDRVLQAFTYRAPDYATKQGPLIVVFHGKSRNADGYRDYACGLAGQCGGLVVAPLFDDKQFPKDAYVHGNVMSGGKVLPKEKWTYTLVPKLIEEIQKREGRPAMPYYLLGHSAGGQFVMRLTALVPLHPVRVVAANPGSDMFPTKDLPFPYGFGSLPDVASDDAALRAYLAAPLTLYLGTADIDPNHPELDKSETAEKQGAFRFARGHNCFDAAKNLAASKGWDFNWRIVEAPGIAHDGRGMFGHAKAIEALFGEAPARQ